MTDPLPRKQKIYEPVIQNFSHFLFAKTRPKINGF